MRTRLTPTDRVAYHTAASLVSNDVVALLSMAIDLMQTLGVRRSNALEGLLSLTRGTLDNAEAGGIDRTTGTAAGVAQPSTPYGA